MAARRLLKAVWTLPAAAVNAVRNGKNRASETIEAIGIGLSTYSVFRFFKNDKVEKERKKSIAAEVEKLQKATSSVSYFEEEMKKLVQNSSEKMMIEVQKSVAEGMNDALSSGSGRSSETAE